MSGYRLFLFLIFCPALFSGCKNTSKVHTTTTTTIPIVIQGDEETKSRLEALIKSNPILIDPNSRIAYNMKIVRPDKQIDYKIGIVKPDPNIDYKLLIFFKPGR